ncbi:MAG TPA: flagellar hook-basal body complex protein [Planctomycetes bacterium]|nr:flagellar hook-basal body complex protein [Planctomycetota bacterium]
MSFALTAGVTGLQAHQRMLDVAGNNLANINTVGFKSSTIIFSELLSQILKRASQPTATIGGVNPQQIGSGVQVAGITPDTSQGNLVHTNSPLDLAVEGEGYFVLSDGLQNVYTRAGAFAVDSSSNLVDPSTGYLVQRTGTVGESDNFQTPGNSNIKVPFDVAMQASGTSEIKVSGNLSADAVHEITQINRLRSDITYTTSGANATGSTKISDLDQYDEDATWADGTITFSGWKPNGDPLGATPTTDLDMAVDVNTTIQNVLDHLNKTNEQQTISSTGTGGTFNVAFGVDNVDIAFGASAAQIETALEGLSTIGAGNVSCSGGDLPTTPVVVEFTGTLAAMDVADLAIDNTNLTGGTASVAETIKGSATTGVLNGATASIVNGRIVVTDGAAGYSLSDLKMEWSDSNLTMPAYFEAATVGGAQVKSFTIIVYDSQGGEHVLSGAFTRTGTNSNLWDLILTSISGNINELTFDNRRIQGIKFNGSDGSFAGLDSGIGDTAQFTVTFAHDTANPQTIAVDMGTQGLFNGLTQFAKASTAVAKEQNGYTTGDLSSVSVSNEGFIIGAFTNGLKKNLAAVQLALFSNPSGLESVGNGHFTPSVNSGIAVGTQGLVGGAGTIHGSSLERSNADVANLFVSMIEAQNGYQANARTIKIANDMLKELTTLIR